MVLEVIEYNEKPSKTNDTINFNECKGVYMHLKASLPTLASCCICVVFNQLVVDFGLLSLFGVFILGCL